MKLVIDKNSVLKYADVKGNINTHSLKIGYLEQSLSDEWKSETVIDYFLKDKPNEEVNYDNYSYLSDIYNILHKFNLSNDILDRTINSLSGGEKIKLQLIKILSNNPKILLLDEPTRNLSPLSNPVIRTLLKEFKGTIISISHDRKYIDEVCPYIYGLTKDGLIERNTY